ncbi:MAG: hypothetical protein ACRCYX_02620, partial [Dermatophilaceae bacterium]
MPYPDDHVRPTHRRSPARPDDDDAYVIDTRRRGSRSAAASPGPTAASASSGRAASVPPGLPPPDPARYDELGRPRAASSPPSRPPVSAPRRSPRRPGRAWLRVLVAGLLLWVMFLVAAPVHAWSTVSRVDSEPDSERPADGAGVTYLLVGSDSREG